MSISLVVGWAVIVGVLVWPVVALFLAKTTSMDTFAIGAGTFSVLIGVLERMDLVFEDPHPIVYIVIGLLLVALGMGRPDARLASRLVGFAGFVMAGLTLIQFRGDEYQGTGSLVLFLVFGVLAAEAIAAKWRDLFFGPLLIGGGLIGYVTGHWDHGLLAGAGVACLLISAGRRHARGQALIEIFAPPLGIAALGLAGIGYITGHRELEWPGVALFWALQGSALRRTTTRSPAASVLEQG